MSRLNKAMVYIIIFILFFVLPLVGIWKKVMTLKQAAFPVLLGLLLALLARR